MLRSVWEGVYTKEQANRGRPVYARTCTECHGDEPVALRPNEHRPVLSENTIEFSLVSDPGASGFSSAPPLAGGVFLRGWKSQTVANLYKIARSEMPQEADTTEVLTPDVLLRRASEIVPALRERAGYTEELRRIPDETVQDLLESGLYRIAVPQMFGGLDVDYALMLEIGALLAVGCPSTSWCYCIWSAHAWLVGF